MDKQERINEIGKQITEEECEPCKVSVILGTAKEICKLADKNTDNKICEALHEKVVMGEISIEDYLRKNIGIASKDPQAKFTLKELLNYHLDSEK